MPRHSQAIPQQSAERCWIHREQPSPGATIAIQNPVSQFRRTTTTNAQGRFTIPNVPIFNPYHLTVTGSGFASYSQDVEAKSAVPVTVDVKLKVESAGNTITVQGGAGDLIEQDPTFHTDVDRGLFDKLPLESASSQLSSLVTLASPGVAADSNGLSMAWVITRPIRFHSMASPLQTSRAKSSRTRFRWMRCSRWR